MSILATTAPSRPRNALLLAAPAIDPQILSLLRGKFLQWQIASE